ncbi:MAG TPA: cupredoxin family copper-binding protein [Candidatus Limnocylindria bacterium]|nr:cupredoxin family copper-binding protein [Candidatus Limnocylindria bacterium]
MRRAAVVWAAALVISCAMLAAPLVVLGATSAVTIQNSAFNPPSTTVRAGDAVRWTNADAFSHTSTADGGLWDTGVIRAGGSASITFTSAGTFAYHCAIHAFMKGTVIVLATSTPPPPPPTAPPPTPVRTAPPTAAPTAPPTAAPTENATAEPTTATPSASPTSVAVETLAVSASPSPIAVQVTPAPGPEAGPGPLLIGAAALAIIGLGAIAFVLARRS